MSTGLIRLITTQKVLKTWSVKGVNMYYLGSNHSPNQHIASPLALKEEKSNEKQDELYIYPQKMVFQKQ